MNEYKDYDLVMFTVTGEKPTLDPMHHVTSGLAIEVEKIDHLHDLLEEVGYNYIDDGHVTMHTNQESWDDDLLEISEAYPNVIFQVHYYGGPENIGCAYILDGKVQYGDAKVEYERFNVELLGI